MVPQNTPSAYNYPLLIKNILFAPIVRKPNQEIVYRDSVRLTYENLHDRVRRLSGALTKLGIKEGDTVAMMDWDSHRYLEAFFAVPMIGAVLHTINVRLSPEQLVYTIDHAEDDIIILNSDFIQMVEHIRGRIDTVKKFILIKEGDASVQSSIDFTGEYEELLAAAEPMSDFPDFDENRTATTFYTTGTTGMPKGVFFSHRQLVLHTLSTCASIATPAVQGRFHRDDVYMPITPMFHVHAWGLPYISTFMGTKQVYPGKYSPDVLLSLIRTENVTFSHCVPTILHMLLADPSSSSVDLSRWKVIIGGAALPKALCIKAMNRGIDIFAGYGMSETCPVLSLAHIDTEDLDLPIDLQAEKRCRTGNPTGLVSIRITDEQNNETPDNDKSSGEILVRAPWLTMGYSKDHSNSEKLWKGGWLHTNDVACRDEKGSLRITDRKKDLIKIGGEWVSSLEIEDIITGISGIAESAVIGHIDVKWGETPLALTVKKNGAEITEKEIITRIKGYIEKGVLPREAITIKVTFVDSLQKTSVGKVNKVALREQYANG